MSLSLSILFYKIVIMILSYRLFEKYVNEDLKGASQMFSAE